MIQRFLIARARLMTMTQLSLPAKINHVEGPGTFTIQTPSKQNASQLLRFAMMQLSSPQHDILYACSAYLHAPFILCRDSFCLPSAAFLLSAISFPLPHLSHFFVLPPRAAGGIESPILSSQAIGINGAHGTYNTHFMQGSLSCWTPSAPTLSWFISDIFAGQHRSFLASMPLSKLPVLSCIQLRSNFCGHVSEAGYSTIPLRPAYKPVNSG